MPDTGLTARKQEELRKRMAALDLREEDLDEQFVKGSGSGGQKINKTSSCVRLLHRPSGVEIKCQRSRSLALNRFLARRGLCERIEEERLGKASARQQKMEKIRRQKRRRSRRQKERMLEAKHRRAETKRLRGKVDREGEA